MSATGRGAERIAEDAYCTPAWAVHRLLERCHLPGGHWLEPFTGEGAIIKAVAQVRNDVLWSAVEIRKECAKPLAAIRSVSGYVIGDLFEIVERHRAVARRQYNVVLTNPPYSQAQRAVETCLTLAPIVVMLLRLPFLASEERADWLGRFMPDSYILPNRPSFAMFVKCGAEKSCGWKAVRAIGAARPKACKCGGSIKITTSDATDYSWLVWERGAKRSYGLTQILNVTPKEERIVRT